MAKRIQVDWQEGVFLFCMDDGCLCCPEDIEVDWEASEVDPTFDEIHPGYVLFDVDGMEYVVARVEGLEEVEWEEPL